MTSKPDNMDRGLTPEDRALLGPRIADELEANVAWLAGRLDRPATPPGLSARLAQAVRGELAARRRRHRILPWSGAAAAALLLVSAMLWYSLTGVDRDDQVARITPPGLPTSTELASARPTAADADLLVENYETTVNRDVVSLVAMNRGVELLGRELDPRNDVPGGEPWAALVDSYDH
ncbi:MAG: hypothetical protein BIFFINMI_02600 [Phycisphaerae bacterium]|nr:hypothetical protein [Phycisphaerae bacterium]